MEYDFIMGTDAPIRMVHIGGGPQRTVVLADPDSDISVASSKSGSDARSGNTASSSLKHHTSSTANIPPIVKTESFFEVCVYIHLLNVYKLLFTLAYLTDLCMFFQGKTFCFFCSLCIELDC